MKRMAFTMRLHPGMEQEYKRRHDELWPELKELLSGSGISDYSIFLDEKSHTLFGVLNSADQRAFDRLPSHPVMRRWWAYMKDIMDSNPDNSPITLPLKEVFYLP